MIVLRIFLVLLVTPIITLWMFIASPRHIVSTFNDGIKRGDIDAFSLYYGLLILAIIGFLKLLEVAFNP